MWLTSLIGCNPRRLKAPLKRMSSHATYLAVYARIFFFFFFFFVVVIVIVEYGANYVRLGIC